MEEKSFDRVAIVALGPTATGYINIAQQYGSRSVHFDQVWIVNRFAGVLEADMIFHMDDLRVQEGRAVNGNYSVGNMLKEFKKTKLPIMTSRRYEDYPTSVEYPLEEVINEVAGMPYFNGTVAYAVAYAIYKRVKQLSLFGCDYAWADTPHKCEAGRACCEYWIRAAQDRGMVVKVLDLSTLLNGGKPEFYGYDTRQVNLSVVNGKAKITFTEKTPPSAEEMEKRYDHTDMSNLKRGAA